MQLFGKVTSSKKTLDLNTYPEILVNMNSGRLNLTNPITNTLGPDLLLGFGYDDSEDALVKACLYKVEDGNGIKVGKKGTAGSKWHSEKLKATFLSEEGMSDEITRFRLSVDMVNTSEIEGTTIYNITFKEALPDLVRTKKEETEELTPSLDNSIMEEDTDTVENNDLENHVDNFTEQVG